MHMLYDKISITGHTRNTRSEKRKTKSTTPKSEHKAVGRVFTLHVKASFTFDAAFLDCSGVHTASRRAYDGNDERIVPARITERAVLNGVGKRTIITPVILQLMLKDVPTL